MIGLQSSIIILAVAIALFVFFLSAAVLGSATESKRQIGRRIKYILGEKEEKTTKKVKKVIGKDGENTVKYVEHKGFLSKFADAISDELKKSGVPMKPEEFAMMWIGLTLIPALLAVMFTNNMLLPPVFAIIGAVGPIFYVKRKQSKRYKNFDSQLSDALMICSNCLRSGLTFAQAMETIADEMDDPISTEFRRVVNEISYGASQDEALESMADRVKSGDFNLVVSAVSVQRQTGGNLSEILDIIGNTIRERAKIRREVKGLTAQGRMSGMIIGFLPVVLLLMLMLVNPDYVMVFFTTPIGIGLISFCVVLELAGFAIINKIVTIKF